MWLDARGTDSYSPGDEVVFARHQDVLLAEHMFLLLGFHYVLRTQSQEGVIKTRR